VSEDNNKKAPHFPAAPLEYLSGARVIYAGQKLNEPSDCARCAKQTHF
jgi:hypothetical protein